MNKKLITNYVTTILVIIPIVAQYGFFTKSITIADLLILPPVILAMWYLLKEGQIVIYDVLYLIFAIWCICSAMFIVPLISGEISNQVILSTIQNIYYFAIVLLLAPKYVNIVESFNIYSKVVIVLCIIVFVQLILNIFTGVITPWVINSSFLPLVYAPDNFFVGGYQQLVVNTFYRPLSLFTEPALFAQYVIPCLVLNIFKKNKSRREYCVIIFVTLATLMSKSANGVVYLVICWGFAFIYRIYRNFKTKSFYMKKKYVIIFSLGLSIVILFMINNSKSIEVNRSFSLTNRLNEILDDKGESSGSMRVMRGWQIYSGLKPLEKIFGIGTGNIVDYLNSNPYIVKMFTQAYNGYMSGLSSIFVNMGIVGAIIYIMWLYKYFKIPKGVVKGLVIFQLLYLIASSSFNTPVFILVTVLIISYSKNIDICYDKWN